MQRSNSGSRKGSGRAGSANMPGSGGSRNNSAGSGKCNFEHHMLTVQTSKVGRLYIKLNPVTSLSDCIT